MHDLSLHKIFSFLFKKLSSIFIDWCSVCRSVKYNPDCIIVLSDMFSDRVCVCVCMVVCACVIVCETKDG